MWLISGGLDAEQVFGVDFQLGKIQLVSYQDIIKASSRCICCADCAAGTGSTSLGNRKYCKISSLHMGEKCDMQATTSQKGIPYAV